jgi:MarR family transcriptional regulator, organic hydroperoxide resistance regulator
MAASPTASAVKPGGEPSPELTALGLAFRRLFRAVSRMRGRDTHLAGGELSHAQFELLIELDECGELSVGELALAARLSPASVTQMLDGLVESGYVDRTRSDSDRRVVLAALTTLGRARVEAKRAAWKERWERVLADISPRDMKAATSVLERLATMFDEAPADAACEAPDGGVQSGSQAP